MAVLAGTSQTPLHNTQCCADWISVEAAGMQRRNITMRQLEPSYISALEILISAAAARLRNGSEGSFEFNEVLCLRLCQVDVQLRLSEVRCC